MTAALIVSAALVSILLEERFLGIRVAANIHFKASSSSPRVLYVPDDYAKIQDAINAAQANDTILVRAGTYNEKIRIDRKKWLTLKGEDTTRTILKGPLLQT